MWQTLETLREREALSDVDVELARLLAEHDPGAGWPVVLGACLASRAPHQGDTCLDLAAQAGRPVLVEDEPIAMAPALEDWRQALAESAVVGEPGEFRPLILEDERLYLQRYWAYEAAIADDLRQRATEGVEGLDTAALRDSLDRFFPESSGDEPDWQKVAAAVAALRRLTLITGGPGTGKTTTVTRLLAALLEQPGGEDRRIALAAPTGKAAARIQEAMHQAKGELALNETLRERIPEQARTLHRLLGARSDSTQFRHHGDHPLPFDVVVVDEASMVDVALFAKLLDAVPPHARLIIVGDRDQLAPVEAGSVLGEITAADPGFSDALGEGVGEVTGMVVPATNHPAPLEDSQVALRRTHRFREDQGLGRLVQAIQAGDPEDALNTLNDERFTEVDWHPLPEDGEGWQALVGELATGFADLLAAGRTGDPARAFQAYRAYGVLNALRQGPLGSEALNRQIETALRHKGRLPATGTWFPGKPVLVVRNDYRLGLFNGDVGIALPNQGDLKIHFESSDGAYRALTPNRLPSHEPAFALTVHKSQGSEFSRVNLLLPETPSGLATRELVYTGISRARAGLTLYGNREMLRRAVSRPLDQASGLGKKISAPI